MAGSGINKPRGTSSVGFDDLPTGWGVGKVVAAEPLADPATPSGATHVGYDNSVSLIPATNVQTAIDTLVGMAGLITAFVFRPGGVAAGNVFVTLAALEAAMAAVQGPKVLQWDSSLSGGVLTITAGAYTGIVDSAIWTSIIHGGNVIPQVIDVDEGVTFAFLPDGLCYAVTVNFKSTATRVWTSPGGGVFQSTTLQYGGTYQTDATATFAPLEVSGGDVLLFSMPFAGNIGPSGGVEVLVVDAGATVVSMVGEGSIVNASVMTGAGSALVQILSSGGQAGTQPGLGGGVLTSLSPQAVYVKYTDTAPLLGATEVQGAIDALKSALAGIVVDIQIFTSSGTWTKPANAIYSIVRTIAGGGGGGAGRRGTAIAAQGGGASGGGGGRNEAVVPASLLGATETVTIGAGGLGATGQTVNNTNGATGTPGGNTTFGAWIGAQGGPGGPGGSLTGSSVIGGSADGGAATQGSASAGTAGFTGIRGFRGGGSSGGSGGGTSAVGAASAGGAGADSGFEEAGGSVAAGGVGGTAGAIGATGGTPTNRTDIQGGAGGGGGGSSAAAAGGGGGPGGKYGGGGGGGGASINGSTSGPGGVGAAGAVLVITYCAP